MLASSPIEAQWLTHNELVEHCRELRDAAEVTDSPCAAYLQGMLAAMAAPEARTAGAMSTEPESAAGRAARTRVGSRLRWLEANRHDSYCIGEDVDVHEVLDAILEHVQQGSVELDVTEPAIVVEALAQRFPCSEP